MQLLITTIPMALTLRPIRCATWLTILTTILRMVQLFSMQEMKATSGLSSITLDS